MEEIRDLGCNIFLIGFMGCGKSTVAASLGKQYHMDVVEMDDWIAEEEGMAIPEIFEKKGEPYFRSLETSFLKGLQPNAGKVVSCGGGVAMGDENVKLMKENGRIVLLTARAETILHRVKRDEGRPLLRGRKNIKDIKELMEARRPRYEAAADITVETDGKSAGKISREIAERLVKFRV